MDTVEELDTMLSRCGSFWYVTLSEEDRKIARTLTQSACRTRVNRQLQEAFSLTKGGGYYRDVFRVIRFRPEDVSWVGTKKALQKRINAMRGAELDLGPGVWLTREDKVAADEHGTPILFPYATDETVAFPGNFRVRYCLTLSPDIFVESIRDGVGRTLLHGSDFISFFGSLWFYENPLKLFPGMTITTKSVSVRARNLYSYTLQLTDVYGPVDRVINYYKGHQSVRNYYLAAAQACGLAVVRSDSVIAQVDPLLGGYSYITRDGARYDAPYRHTMLTPGTALRDGDVIGGTELFTLYGPEDLLPDTVTELDLGNALPVPGLIAKSEEAPIWYTFDGTLDYYRPALHAPENDPTAVARYHALLAAKDGGPEDTEAMLPWESGNVLEHVRNEVLRGRCIVVCVNEAFMSRSMRLRLDAFLRREVPLGAVLTYAKITSTIPAEE